MTQLRILVVGRRATDPLLDAADAYLARLVRYTKAELVRVREGTLDSERSQLERKIPSPTRLIALDERGTQLTTAHLADTIGQWQQRGVGRVTFLIGGADGLHPDLKRRADETWALSAMTLPHRLALVLLLEQLYRAYTILRGERYHRA